MPIKRILILSTILITVDQGVKWVIFHLFMDKQLILLPHILRFRPMQNINLSYIGSLLNMKIPLAVMILLETIGVCMIIMVYRYCVYMSTCFYKVIMYRNVLNLFLAFGLSGILCGFIDNVFWIGSLDFIQLFNWFIFDLKDVYLSTMSALMILYMLLVMPGYYRLSKEDRKQYDLTRWIKAGCPVKSSQGA